MRIFRFYRLWCIGISLHWKSICNFSCIWITSRGVQEDCLLLRNPYNYLSRIIIFSKIFHTSAQLSLIYTLVRHCTLYILPYVSTLSSPTFKYCSWLEHVDNHHRCYMDSGVCDCRGYPFLFWHAESYELPFWWVFESQAWLYMPLTLIWMNRVVRWMVRVNVHIITFVNQSNPTMITDTYFGVRLIWSYIQGRRNGPVLYV